MNGWLKIPTEISRCFEREGTNAQLAVADFTKPLGPQCADAHVLLPSVVPVDAALVEQATNLRFLMQPAKGTNNLDLRALADRGVPVCNTPDGNIISTAETTVALLMSLSRQVTLAQRILSAGCAPGTSIADWQATYPDCHNLHGRVAGFLGFGAIGKRVGRVCEALGMDVRAVRSTSSRADLEELLRSAHVLFVCLPLTAETAGLVGERELSLLPPDALVVNTARGPIVQKDAITRAIIEGSIGGYATDVHWEEPVVDGAIDPLYSHHRVVATPHIAPNAAETWAAIAAHCARSIRLAQQGRFDELDGRVA